jgi:fluoride exporter
VCRYWLDRWITARSRGLFPFGIFWVNVSGSLVLGAVTGSVLFDSGPPSLAAVAGTGFCGAYTTFSTYTFETVRLMEDRRYRTGLAYLGLSLVTGLVAAGAGLASTRWL